MLYPRVKGYDEPETLNNLKDKVENLVAIPSRNTAPTIPYVIYNAAEGLEKLGGTWSIIVVDGLSSDQTVSIVNNVKKDIGTDKLYIIPNTISPGKGGAMKLAAIIANYLGARTLVFLDSDLRSITLEWPIQLVNGAVKCGYTTPNYIRDRFDATITNFVARPLTVMSYMVNIKQPIGGEFGLGKSLINYLAEKAPWNSVYWNLLFGTDIFITHTALSLGITPCEANLGSKIHEAKDPGKRLKGMFIEVTGSLFNALIEYGSKWTKITGEIREPEQILEPKPVYIPPPRITVDPERAYQQYISVNNEANRMILEKKLKLPKELYKKISGGGELSSRDWAEIIFNGYKAFLETPVYSYRVLILETLYHLWQGRLYTYYKEASDAPIELVREALNSQIRDVVAKRGEFLQETIKHIVF